jgi:hypothetical protein
VGARTALATFLADFAPDVVTLEMKESAATYGADLAVLLPILRTACPTAAIIGLGSTPLAVNDADQVAQNAALKAACAAKGCTYWDGYSPVVSYANLNALGWAGDGTHVDDKANAFLGGLLLRDLAILNHPGLVSPRDINAATVLVTGNLGGHNGGFATAARERRRRERPWSTLAASSGPIQASAARAGSPSSSRIPTRS